MGHSNLENISILGKRCAKISEIRQQVQRIVEAIHPEKIILFGSYAYGTPTPESDVDLLIIVDQNRSPWEISVEISLMLDHFFPLDIVVKTNNEIEKRLRQGDFFIQDILEKGKVLYERTGSGMDR